MRSDSSKSDRGSVTSRDQERRREQERAAKEGDRYKTVEDRREESRVAKLKFQVCIQQTSLLDCTFTRMERKEKSCKEDLILTRTTIKLATKPTQCVLALGLSVAECGEIGFHR